MANFFKQQWEHVRGNAIWDAIKFWVWPVISVAIPTIIGWIEGVGEIPKWALSIIALGTFAIGLLIANELRRRRIGKREETAKIQTQLSRGAIGQDWHPCPETWPHVIADLDKTRIDMAVPVIGCTATWDFSAVPPYIRFEFIVFNGSVYLISLRTVEGYIQYGNRRLKEEITLSTKWRAENISPRHSCHIEIIQWLSDEEKEVLQQDWNAQSFQSYFSFKQLNVVISGGDNAEQVVAKPLWFNHITGIALNGRLR